MFDKMNAIDKFVKDFKKLMNGETLGGESVIGGSKIVKYEFDYSKYQKAFDAILEKNVLKTMVKVSMDAHIKKKYNTPRKGYECIELLVAKQGDIVEFEFVLSILRGRI